MFFKAWRRKSHPNLVRFSDQCPKRGLAAPSSGHVPDRAAGFGLGFAAGNAHVFKAARVEAREGAALAVKFGEIGQRGSLAGRMSEREADLATQCGNNSHRLVLSLVVLR